MRWARRGAQLGRKDRCGPTSSGGPNGLAAAPTARACVALCSRSPTTGRNPNRSGRRLVSITESRSERQRFLPEAEPNSLRLAHCQRQAALSATASSSPATPPAGRHAPLPSACPPDGRACELPVQVRLPTSCRLGAAAVYIPTVRTAPVLLNCDRRLTLYFAKLTAHLTLADRTTPVPVQIVRFSGGGDQLCRATTGADGVATCDGVIEEVPTIPSGGYEAVFEGTPASTGARRPEA